MESPFGIDIPFTWVVLVALFTVAAFYIRKISRDLFPSDPISQREPLQIRCVSTEFNDRIISECSTLQKGYKAPFWGRSGHVQTMYHMFVRQSPKFLYERVFVDSRGEKLAVDIHSASSDSKKSVPTIIIVPGIAGSSKQHYVRNFVHCCKEKGWRSVVINHRGCNSDIQLPEFFSIGDPFDLRAVFKYVHQTYPNSPIFAAGFSMGANILMNYVGRYHNKNGRIDDGDKLHIPLMGVVSVSQGYSLLKTCEVVKRKKLYNFGLTSKVVGVVKRHKNVFEKLNHIDVDSVLKVSSMPDFDQVFTCKLYNIEAPEEYYARQCCSKYVPHIDVPSLLINALDDPLVPESQLEPVFKACKTNDKLIMATTLHGGHLGFHEGDIAVKQATWMDRAGVEYIENVIKINYERTSQSSNVLEGH